MGTQGFQRGMPVATIQVKSWSAPPRSGVAWHYRELTEDQFNVLAGQRAVPAFLVLVVVPSDAKDYTHARQDRLELCHAAYWISLADKPLISNPSSRQRVPVDVPRENLLTVETLIRLCSPTSSDCGTDAQLASGI